MPKNNNKKALNEIDPQRLFQQFAPNLHFNEPKLSAKEEGWFIIAEQPVPAARNNFWETIMRWTAEPQFVIPPIEKAEIKSIVEREEENHTESSSSQDPLKTTIRELIPKRKSKDANLTERVEYFENDRESRVVYTPIIQNIASLPFYYPKVKAYSFIYDSGSIEDFEERQEEKGTLRLEIVFHNSADQSVTDPKMQYALKAIIHKLFKWCIQTRLGYKKKAQHDVLVTKETYQSMYQSIKSKYGPELVANWTEKTDPKKFVYEDLAIASYLLCLWKQEELHTKKKPTFIDLGCGNGLLTFLLVSEGYQGYGIDIADRKIWPALCKDKTEDMLRVEAIYPAQVSYPNTDWLIGNHADELVPWIPIIASKSGVNCKFMVIPCCFYALDGTRSLSLPDSDSLGKYRAYTNYVKDIATKVGYNCQEDYLRIPSTKNIALVGTRLKTAKEEEVLLLNQQQQEIEIASKSFIPRKTDREKEEIRQESLLLKKQKLD